MKKTLAYFIVVFFCFGCISEGDAVEEFNDVRAVIQSLVTAPEMDTYYAAYNLEDVFNILSSPVLPEQIAFDTNERDVKIIFQEDVFFGGAGIAYLHLSSLEFTDGPFVQIKASLHGNQKPDLPFDILLKWDPDKGWVTETLTLSD